MAIFFKKYRYVVRFEASEASQQVLKLAHAHASWFEASWADGELGVHDGFKKGLLKK